MREDLCFPLDDAVDVAEYLLRDVHKQFTLEV